MSRVYGANAVGDLLAVAPQSVVALFIAKGSTEAVNEALVQSAQEHGIPIRDLPRDLLKQRAGR
jgi:tRNA G18 (ribose-2'-O)-methylase SpoU